MSQNIQLDLFNNFESTVSDPGLDNFEKEMMHFDKLKLEQGFETVWNNAEINDGPLETKLKSIHHFRLVV